MGLGLHVQGTAVRVTGHLAVTVVIRVVTPGGRMILTLTLTPILLHSSHSPNAGPPPHPPHLGAHDALHIYGASVSPSFSEKERRLSTVSWSDNRMHTPVGLGLRIQV